MIGRQTRWAPSPRPNSGLPEFGRLDWPKLDKSGFGWGEGGGEGVRDLSIDLYPSPQPSPHGRGSPPESAARRSPKGGSMNVAVGNDTMALRQLYAQQDLARLAQAAERIALQQSGNGEAWRFWGIGELMQLRGGPDKLLRASLLEDAEAGLWLGMLQEFSAHPHGTVRVTDFVTQVELAKIRRSPYLDYPQEVHIETFAYCNAKCTFCPYPTMERQGDKMPDA